MDVETGHWHWGILFQVDWLIVEKLALLQVQLSVSEWKR
jgi:hypothetical protein